MLDELTVRIWKNPQFQADLRSLITSRVRDVALSMVADVPMEESVAQRLLQSAAILAQSHIPEHREAAYRISTAIYATYKTEYGNIDKVLYLVLARLGNFPAIRYSQQGSVEPPQALPFMLALESTHRLMGNTVQIRQATDAGNDIVLTDFQRHVWNGLGEGASLGASAPTSAGKSFLLQAFIRKLWALPVHPRIVYIVPTRALINQVSAEIASALKSDGVDEIEIVTVPIATDQQIPENALFVMTQERLQLVLTNHSDITFDFAIVDEAQAVGDGSRGVILTAVLEELMRRNSTIQMFFASPNVSNPEIFGRLFALKNYHYHKSRDVTVAQNLIHLNTSGTDPRRVKALLHLPGEKLPLGEFLANDDLANIRQATLHLSHLLGQGGQNLIYAKGPSDCQDIALGLMQLEEPKKEALQTTDAGHRLKELSAFVKESVHPEYALAETVLNGVGFHYGAMPPLLRRSVEDAFRNGDLKFLASTSTLLHGLNLPARNLFLNRPERGNHQPIESVDFWNLAGRAGRLGKEFEGNVFLIDYDDWANKPLEGDKELQIKPTLDEHLHERSAELVEYIKDSERKPDPQGNDEFENTFTKLFTDHREGHLNDALSRLEISPQSALHGEITGALAEVDTQINLADEVIRSSPTVSVYRQQRLYDYMLAKIDKEGPEYLMPIHPMREGAYDALTAIFKRCHNHIFQWPTRDRRHLRAAVFALPWMKGMPLPQIIDAHFQWASKNRPRHQIKNSILETLQAIEEDVRFTYVRLTGCYNTLLKRALIEKGHAQMAERIVPIPLFLEVGACSQTMMSFIGFGLSRITSRKLTEAAARHNLGPVEAKTWLRRQKLEVLGVSPIIINEIRRMVI